MVRIGIIGIGFMGYAHFEAIKQIPGGRVIAFATRDEKKRSGDWSSIQGNFGPPAGQVDVTELRVYHDYHDLLSDPEIDLVDICLPTKMHEEVVLEAIAAGKTILVEKPITYDSESADRLVQAAEQAGVLLMVAQVLPAFPEFGYLLNLVETQQYGPIQAAHFRRVICPPDWSETNFQELGGWGIDLHIHDNHFVSLICGVPDQIFSQGIFREGLIEHVHTHYLYEEKPLPISCVSGGIAAAGLQFGHGFEVYFEKATLLFDFETLDHKPILNKPLTLITAVGDVVYPELKQNQSWCAAFTAELAAAVEAVATKQAPRSYLSAKLAREALKICEAEVESILKKQAVSLKS